MTAWCKTPLAHSLDGTFVEAVAEAAGDVYVGDPAVAPDDKCHEHVTRDSAAPCLLRVIRFDFLQERRRFHATSRTIRSASSASIRAISDAAASSVPCAVAVARTRARIVTRTATVAGGCGRSDDAVLIGGICGGRRHGSFRRRRSHLFWSWRCGSRRRWTRRHRTVQARRPLLSRDWCGSNVVSSSATATATWSRQSQVDQTQVCRIHRARVTRRADAPSRCGHENGHQAAVESGRDEKWSLDAVPS